MIDSEIIYRGRCFAISGITVKGKCLAQEFIEDLEEPDEKKLVALLRRTADNGLPRNKEKFKHLKDKICEFKSYQVRILCFLDENKLIILTHGFIKKQDKTPRSEIERAQKLMEDYQQRGKKK